MVAYRSKIVPESSSIAVNLVADGSKVAKGQISRAEYASDAPLKRMKISFYLSTLR
jgi:hypothetical protein